MFPKKTDTTAENLDLQINAHLAAMATLDPLKSQEYGDMVKHLNTLYSLRETAKPMSTGEKATIVAHLAGIALVLNHERLGVITSKAFGLIMKLR